MTYPFTEYLICRNNYFEDPNYVVNLSLTQTYRRAEYYPGFRTENLLNLENFETKKFAENFANKLSIDVFPGISNYSMSLYFHMNEPNSNSICNQGWIHADTSKLAGLVYLTQNENNFYSGTSMFYGKSNDSIENKKIREEYNKSGIATEEYITCLKENQKSFTETIRIGNVFNRLVAYDSKMYHRPNSYSTEVGKSRLTLVFFISNFEYTKN